MKKLFFIAAFAACAFGMNAQLKVLNTGNVQIGSATATIDTDSDAAINILRSNNKGAGGYLTFGNIKNVGLGELASTSTAAALLDTDVLQLFGSRGMIFTVGDNTIFSYRLPSISPSFIFSCDVKANSLLIGTSMIGIIMKTKTDWIV